LKYVELHSASAFSFLEGASRPEDLISRAKELELSAIALVDRDGVYGAPRFHMAAKSVGVRPHVGSEISVEGFGSRANLPTWLPNSTSTRPVRLTLLVESRKGYQNLCRLITRYKLREKEKGTGTATLDEVGEHAEGLVCLTGGEEGVLAASLFHHGYEEARKNLEIRTSFSAGGPRPEPSPHPEILGAVRADSGFAAASRTTLGGNGRMPGAARRGGST
jgi:error-prone DNA polymerase